MRIADVVLLDDLEEFCAFRTDKKDAQRFAQTLAQTTYLYFPKVSYKLATADQLETFCAQLRKCIALVSINLTSNDFDDWQPILAALATLSNLRYVNIRNSNILRTDVQTRINNDKVFIIDRFSTSYSPRSSIIPLHNLTAHEYTEMLLVGLNAHRQYPNITSKFSRKRYAELPCSVLIINGKPVLLLRTRSISPDIDDYNKHYKRLKYNYRIKVVLSFADNTIHNLTHNMVKVRPRVELDDKAFVNEKHTLQSETEVLSLQRTQKSYVSQPLFASLSFDEKIYQEYYRNIEPSMETRIRRVVGMLTAVALFHARGLIHLDVKPANLLLVDELLVLLIDLESAQNCPGEQKIKLTDCYTTKAYRPPEVSATIPAQREYGRSNDAFAVGLTARFILTATFYTYHGKTYYDSITTDPYHEKLEQFFDQQLKSKVHENIVAQVHGLLSTDPKTRLVVAEVLAFFQQNYHRLTQNSLEARYKYELSLVTRIFVKYSGSEIEVLFAQVDALAQGSRYLIALKVANLPDNLTLADIILANLMVHIMQLFALCKGQPTDKMTLFFASIFQEIAAIGNLDSINVNAVYQKIARKQEFVNEAFAMAPQKIRNLRLVLLARGLFVAEDPCIEALNILHKQIESHILDDAPLQDILAFAIDGLKQILAGQPDEVVRHEIQLNISSYAEIVEEFGTSNRSPLVPNPNPLVFSPPNHVIRQVSRFITVHEIPNLIQEGIHNDENDVAKLTEFLPYYRNDDTIAQTLVKLGAYSLYWYIRLGDIKGVKKMLERGDDPSIPYRPYDTPLRRAYGHANTAQGREIFALVLEYVKEDDLLELVKFMRIDLNFDTLDQEDRDRIIIMLKVMVKHPDIFTFFFGETMHKFMQKQDIDSITLFVTNGVDPLTPINDELDIPSCVHPFFLCEEKPYLFFTGCRFNLITNAMQKGDYARVRQLLQYIQPSATSSKQLGYHLVVAASLDQRQLVLDLIAAGADLDCKYPVGKMLGKDVAYFAKYYRYMPAFDAAVQQRQPATVPQTPSLPTPSPLPQMVIV